MKKFALALLSALLCASPVFAIVGGPWDGDVPGNPVKINPNTIPGTYQGVIRGQKGSNITGVMLFGTGDTSTAKSTSTSTLTGSNSWTYTSNYFSAQGMGTSGNEGRFVLYFNGQMAVGMLSTTLNPSAKKIGGVFEGSSSPSSLSYTALVGYVVNETQTTGTDGSVKNTLSSAPETLTYTLNNVTTVSGAFNATLKIPESTFSGKGTLALTYIDSDALIEQMNKAPMTATPQMVTVLKKISVSGARTSNATPTFGGTLNIQTPSATYSIDVGGATQTTF